MLYKEFLMACACAALCRIHAQGNAFRSKNHPDSRAILFEDRIYSKKKILEFISTLAGFKCAEKIASLFQGLYRSVSYLSVLCSKLLSVGLGFSRKMCYVYLH
jgi:DNA mismatch repair protein MSH6